MARLRIDFAGGILSVDANPSDTTLTSPAFTTLPAIVAPDYLPITLDPGGQPEICYITAHTASANTVTVTRQAEAADTNPAILHVAGRAWINGPTKEDYDGRLRIATSMTLPSAPDDGMTYALEDTLDVVTYLSGAWQTVGGIPTGVILAFAGAVAAHGSITPPNGYLFCNGQAVNPSTNPALWNLLHTAGNPYGVDGSSNPLVPDLRDKRIAGAGGEYATGATGGRDTYSLGLDDMPNHTHPITDPGHNHAITDPQHQHSTESAPGVTPGWVAVSDNASTLGIPAGSSNKVTFTTAVTSGFAHSNITVNSHTAGINTTSGVASYGAQTAVDLRAPYLAAPFIIKAT